MKIAFLSTFYPYRGGIAQFNASFYRALEKNHEVQAFNFSLQYPRFLFPGKTQYVSPDDQADQIPSRRTLNSINPLSYHNTVKAIKQYNPDILIIGYWMPFMAPSLGYIARRLNKKCNVISIVHNAIPHEKSIFDRILSNYFFKSNKKIVSLSHAVSTNIKQYYPSLKITSISHPIYSHFGESVSKESALAKLKLNADKNYILFFGLIRPYKGLDILLESLIHIDQSFELIIAGETYGSFENYRQIISKNNLDNRIHHFNHYISDNMVKYFFSASQCCILPYKSATQSGIIAIANHYNTPVISSNVGGLSEFIENGKDGLLIDEINPFKISEVLNQPNSSELFSNIRNNLKEKKHGNWDDFSADFLHFSNQDSL